MGLCLPNKMWKKDEMAALIALFETERCLYDDNDENFHDADKQMDAYKRICKIMLRIRPDCTVDEIKYKIKFLRRQYVGELLHRNISVKSGLCTKDSYKPSMWCFGLLQFLDDFVQDKNVMNSYIEADEKREFAGSPDVADESDDPEDVEEENISNKKRKLESSSSSEREMINTSSVRKFHSSSSERKLQSTSSSERKLQSTSNSEKKFHNTSSQKKFHNTSSQRKFRNTSSVQKFQNSSSEKKFQNTSSNRKYHTTSSSEKKFLNSSSAEKKLQNTSSVDRKMSHSSSSERDMNVSSGSESTTKRSFSSEKELKNGSVSEMELQNTSSPGKALDALENTPGQSPLDREEIFGQYVATELRALRSNPLLYLQTKQSILESLTSANFEFINPE